MFSKNSIIIIAAFDFCGFSHSLSSFCTFHNDLLLCTIVKLSSRRASAQAVTLKWQLCTTSPMNTDSSTGENGFSAKNILAMFLGSVRECGPELQKRANRANLLVLFFP